MIAEREQKAGAQILEMVRSLNITNSRHTALQLGLLSRQCGHMTLAIKKYCQNVVENVKRAFLGHSSLKTVIFLLT